MAIGKLYASHSTSRETANFNEIPFHSASIDWNRTDASTMTFRSPQKLAEADRIRYQSNEKKFGGQIYKIKKTTNDDYQYEVISYLRLYHDKVTCSFKNKTSSQIMKKVLKMSKNNFVTSGVKNTNVVHSYLKWENTSIWEIALQLCWLEHKAGYEARAEVDENGVLRFGYLPKQQKGYSFSSVFNYEEEYDYSNIITQATITANGKNVANATASNGIIAKWGYVTEQEDCTETKTAKNTSNTKKNESTSLRDNAQIQKYNIPSKIVKQALSIAKTNNTQYQNLKLLYNWCNAHIGYVGYANSLRGAEGCLSKRGGNCCDNANLMIGMARSIGIKCRYAHAKQGSNGHVYGEYYINNRWLVVDTGTKSSNKYWGSHWNGFGGTDRRYDKLPF